MKRLFPVWEEEILTTSRRGEGCQPHPEEEKEGGRGFSVWNLIRGGKRHRYFFFCSTLRGGRAMVNKGNVSIKSFPQKGRFLEGGEVAGVIKKKRTWSDRGGTCFLDFAVGGFHSEKKGGDSISCNHGQKPNFSFREKSAIGKEGREGMSHTILNGREEGGKGFLTGLGKVTNRDEEGGGKGHKPTVYLEKKKTSFTSKKKKKKAVTSRGGDVTAVHLREKRMAYRPTKGRPEQWTLEKRRGNVATFYWGNLKRREKGGAPSFFHT